MDVPEKVTSQAGGVLQSIDVTQDMYRTNDRKPTSREILSLANETGKDKRE